MYDKLNIVIPSRVPISEKYDFVENLKETSECDIFVFWIENPVGESLSVLYNDILDSEHINGNIIVFMHDDVEILKKGWGKEILRLFNKHRDYGIIGVAGSGQFDEECTWWNYPECYGQILYRSEGKEWIAAYSKLLKKDLQEVCVVDGVFMAVDKSRIKEYFDENIKGCVLYDNDFCLANYLTNETKVGVTTNIRLCHNSNDESKPEWDDNKEYIIQKYEDKFPIIIK